MRRRPDEAAARRHLSDGRYDETVHLTPVSVTQFDADDVLVDGLDAGTIVVTAGVHCLEEGQSVRTEADK